MRVLFVTSAYPSRKGDPRGIHVHRLAASLAKEGVEVTVVTPSAAGAQRREELDGVVVHRAQYWFHRRQFLASGVGGIMPNLKARRWLMVQVPLLIASLGLTAAKVAREGYDVVHAHWLFPAGLVALTTSHRANAPLVVTSHGGDLNLTYTSPWATRVSRFVARRAQLCLGVSDSLCRRFEEIGVPPHRVALAPLGVEIDDSPRVRAQSPELRLLYVGSLIARKNVPVVLRALKRLQGRSISIQATFAGEGPEREVLERQAFLDGLDVRFLGSVPPDLVIELLREADVLVLPSWSEGRPVVVLEAMALGLPVAASDIPGNRELVVDGQTGFLFNPDDDQALAEILEHLAVDREVGERLGRGGRAALVDKGLSTGESARRHIDLYRSLQTNERVPVRRSRS